MLAYANSLWAYDNIDIGFALYHFVSCGVVGNTRVYVYIFLYAFNSYYVQVFHIWRKRNTSNSLWAFALRLSFRAWAVYIYFFMYPINISCKFSLFGRSGTRLNHCRDRYANIDIGNALHRTRVVGNKRVYIHISYFGPVFLVGRKPLIRNTEKSASLRCFDTCFMHNIGGVSDRRWHDSLSM